MINRRGTIIIQNSISAATSAFYIERWVTGCWKRRREHSAFSHEVPLVINSHRFSATILVASSAVSTFCCIIWNAVVATETVTHSIQRASSSGRLNELHGVALVVVYVWWWPAPLLVNNKSPFIEIKWQSLETHLTRWTCPILFHFAEEEEVTKRSIRVECWKKIQNEKIATNNRYIFNRITNFVDAEKAAELLAETPEFKNASE